MLLTQRRMILNRKMLGFGVIMFGGAALLILPFYLPLLTDATSQAAYLQNQAWLPFSTDPLAFLSLSIFTPWTKLLAPPFSAVVLGTNSTEGTAYLGLIALVLAVVGLRRPRREWALWLIIALGCMIFSFGPLLKWQEQPIRLTLGDYSTNIVMPWALFQNLPFIKVTRTPGRFNITTGLMIGILAALGANEVLGKVKYARQRNTLFVIGSIAILFEYQLFYPFPATPAVVSPYFSELAEKNNIRAVLDVPWDDPLAQKAALLEQTVHHKPLIAGYVSRQTTIDPARFILLSDLALGRATSGFPIIPAASDMVRTTLKASGIDIVVVHLGLLNREQIIPQITRVLSDPVYQDKDVAIFSVVVSNAEITGDTIPVTFNRWWSDTQDKSQIWFTHSSIYLYAPTVLDKKLTVHFAPLLQPRTLRLSVDGKVVQSWMVNPPSRTLDVYLKFGPGFHTLEFTTPESCISPSIAPRCLLEGTTVSYQNNQCQLADKNICVSLALDNFQLGDIGPLTFQEYPVKLTQGLRLMGFRVPPEIQAGSPLTVQTDWQATEKLPGDYHYFVHIIDSTGKLAAQSDGVPGEGTFATTQWDISQLWEASTTLANLTTGTYKAYVGWYRYPDMAALSTIAESGKPAEAQIYLRDITVH